MCSSLVMGNMIGSGIFLLPVALAPYGGFSLVGWLITATGAMLLALVFARLSRRLPRSGGPYAYARAGFVDFAGFIVAWGYWISILATNAALTVAAISYLSTFWPTPAREPVVAAALALGCVWLFTGVNALGVRQSGVVQVVTTALKLVPLVAIAAFGIFYIDISNLSFTTPGSETGFTAVNATVALTLWAFLGLESATTPADEVVDPARTISRATRYGTILTTVIYILSTTAVIGVLSSETLATSNGPFVDAASRMWGEWAGYAVGFGAIVSCLGALNGWTLLQAQIPLATARDGLFPPIFARVSRNGTPVAGLLISSVLVSLILLLNYTKNLVELFTFIILLATITCLIPYILSSAAELIFLGRSSKAGGPVGSSASFLIAAGALLYSIWAVAGTGQEAVYWGFLLLTCGVPVYVWLRRRDGKGGELPLEGAGQETADQR